MRNIEDQPDRAEWLTTQRMIEAHWQANKERMVLSIQAFLIYRDAFNAGSIRDPHLARLITHLKKKLSDRPDF